MKRLPAEFECPLCFKVKKFYKPSDWTKHVHEDVQPFTCTFPNCGEPKSFKRKADWVRHENERHRQLENWTCQIADCSHTCYRKDNFVQHLVREHKIAEPRARVARGGNKDAPGGSHQGRPPNLSPLIDTHADIIVDDSWSLVERCRRDTTKQPKDEPCRFCGNICNSWKKLTVHLARHMEQLSIPVLELVKIREVNPDTIISPLEQRPPVALTPSPIDQQQSSSGIPNAGNPYNSTDAYGMPTMMSNASMTPGMFAPMAGNYPTNVHAHAHAHQQQVGHRQFPDAQAGLYQHWPQQPPMQFGATGAPSYGSAAAVYGASNGQPDFGAGVYMDDASANAFNAQPQMVPWNVNAVNAGNGQFASMSGYPQHQAPRGRGTQQGAANQQPQQHQYYGGGWNNEYQ